MFLDPYLDTLKEAAQFLDRRVSKRESDAQCSEDPDMTGEYDGAEYTIGLGFVACQQYMTCVFADKSIDKRAVLELGPRHACGVTYAALVNAAANTWKHYAKWERPGAERARAEQASELLRRIGVDVAQDYPLADALQAIMRPKPPRFRSLVPFLEQWRTDVIKSDAGLR